MNPTSYFGRAESDGRRLGADFDLLAKWTKACSVDPPIHSYYLTQLSPEDRAQLFTGPAQDFQLEQGPDNTVKLKTLEDEVSRLDPAIIEMIKSKNYQRSEARHLELLNEIEDAQDEAGGAHAMALAHALMQGMDGPPAEELADKVSERILDAAGAKVWARWRSARDERLRTPDNQNHTSPDPASPEPQHISVTTLLDDTETSDSSDATPGRRSATKKKRKQGVAVRTSFSPSPIETTHSNQIHGTKIHRNGYAAPGPPQLQFGANLNTPQQKLASSIFSPSRTVPDYGSETSTESTTHWNSPTYSANDSPSSPDLDSEVDFLGEADGGVALLPMSLSEELGLYDSSNSATPTPASRVTHSPFAQTSEGLLGAGLKQAFFNVPTNINSILMNNFVLTSNPAAVTDPFITPQVVHEPATEQSDRETSSPFSPNSKAAAKYAVASEQPWMGFTCYEVPTRLSNDQLAPKYWTTKRGKERYIRHKLGELKLDDAKLLSDRGTGSVARNPVHVFVDMSNIIIGFYDTMKEARGMSINKRVMAPAFSFKNFHTILTRDRNVAKKVVAGSVANSYNKPWPEYMVRAEELGYEMNILERVPKPSSPVRKRKTKSGVREMDAPTSGADTSGEDCFAKPAKGGPVKHGEQGVDELLHLKILQSAMDTQKPATMVLATGDAASAQYSDGFKKNIERVLDHGWNIELYGWSRNISSAWREPEFSEAWGHKFKIIELDEYCEELFDMTIESLEA
ncbi:hypothetical protein B0J18DRAFT_306040 [Chaetomium sp. MPI-SDFR-AT-0129]|nr:hypothetical protein B0J18DRAFT_306040 [Chaetomium sp. MPI-SDFR-AT-0129]